MGSSDSRFQRVSTEDHSVFRVVGGTIVVGVWNGDGDDDDDAGADVVLVKENGNGRRKRKKKKRRTI
jgi:hypothetical protein